MATHRADASQMLDDRGYSGKLIRGQNPAMLMEKAVRDRITESYYWKEQCFGLNEATLCDRAVDVTYVGGITGTAQKPTPFLCLAFKLLQLAPEKDIILEYLSNEEFKYLRALGAFYVRLTFDPAEVYKTLEPLLADYRKLRRRVRTGYSLTYIDQFVDELMVKDRVCATSLWKLPSRQQLEDFDLLDERVSPLAGELDDSDADDDGDRRTRDGSREGEDPNARRKGEEDGEIDGRRNGERSPNGDRAR